MKFRYIAAGLATAGLTLLGAGTASAAPAAPVNGPFYTNATAGPSESGYEIQSSTRFNDQRATFCVPAGSTSSVGLGLQQSVNGGKTVGMALYYQEAPSPNTNPDVGSFFLVGGNVTVAPDQPTGTPLISLSLSPSDEIASIGTPAGQPLFSNTTGGCYYLEVRQSTEHGLVNLIAGPAEDDAATLGTIFNGIHTTFNAPFIGVLNAFAGHLPVSAQQVSISRNGVTEPAGWNRGGIAGTRVTFDYFALDETEATLNGGNPTVVPANPVVLFNSPALPGTGSAFGVVTGS